MYVCLYRHEMTTYSNALQNSCPHEEVNMWNAGYE